MNKLLACTKLFMGLQAMEPLLLGGRRVRITRTTDGNLVFGVYAIGDARACFSVTCKTREGMAEEEVHRQLDIVWRALSEEGLIDPLVLGRKQLCTSNGN